jgi:hypothetical protein
MCALHKPSVMRLRKIVDYQAGGRRNECENLCAADTYGLPYMKKLGSQHFTNTKYKGLDGLSV